MWNNKKVSLIFPTYKEKNSIRNAIKDFESCGFLDEIIVVNNNAEVGTSEEVLAANSKITKEVLEKKQGYGFAIRRGFEEATGELIIVSEPDSTFFGRDVVKLLAYSDAFDVVYGSRTAKELIWKGANMGWFLRWGNFFMAKLVEVLFNTTSLTDVGCTMRLIKKEVIEKISPHFTVGREHFGPEMMILTFLHKFKVLQIPVNYTERVGESAVTGNQWKAFRLGLIMLVLILKYRLSFFGRFHLPRVKQAFNYLQNALTFVLDKVPGLRVFKVPLIYYVALLYFALFFGLTYLRWQAHTPSMDYHAYVQMLHNTVRGDMLMYNQGRGAQTYFFKLHFAPFLLLVAVIYNFIQHPLTLYFIFYIFISLSIVAVYLTAKKALKNKFMAYLIAFSYALYHPFVWSHQQGFAEEAFATPLLSFAFYFLYTKREKLYILFSLLTLALRINMIMPVMMLGIYAFFSKRAKFAGAFMSLLSIIWLLFIMNFITPRYTTPGQMPYIYGYFHAYGSSFSEIAQTMIFHPQTVLENMLAPKKLEYLGVLFKPVFFVSFLSPEILFITLPIFVINMLASNTRLISTVSYYHSSITPFVFFAFIFSIAKIYAGSWYLKKIAKGLVVGVFCYALYSNASFSYGSNWPFNRFFNIRSFERGKRDAQIDKVIKRIPATYAVGAPDVFVEHIAQRKWYYDDWAYPGTISDLILVDPWKGNLNIQLANEVEWLRVLESAYFLVFARRDLIHKYNVRESGLMDSIERLPSNQHYLAFLEHVKSMDELTTGLGRDQSVDITADVVFAQELHFKYSKVENIEFPIEAIEHPVANLKDKIANLIKPPHGRLLVQIVKNESQAPFGKEVYRTYIDYKDLTHKIDMTYLELNEIKFDPSSLYWLVFSMDKYDGKSYEKYNKYRIYTSALQQPSLEDGYKLYSDRKVDWKNVLGNTELLYKIHYRPNHIPSKYLDWRLLNGTYVLTGSPSEILSIAKEINSESTEYEHLTILGTERSLE